MWKRLALLWTVVRGDARKLWRALRHPASPGWLKVGVGLMCRHCVARSELFDRIQNDEIGQITMLHPPRVHGWVSVQKLVEALMGAELPKLTSLAPYQAEVTPENASSFYAADQPDDYWPL